MFSKFILITTLILLQSCSNSPIGEKLENSFDVMENPKNTDKTNQIEVTKRLNEIKKIKSSKKNYQKLNENLQVSIKQNNLTSNKDKFSQNSTKQIKKVIFNPQPYRIILKLSGANPSAPAETVTKALRKAGVEFEVEKIERVDEKSLLMNSSLKR